MQFSHARPRLERSGGVAIFAALGAILLALAAWAVVSAPFAFAGGGPTAELTVEVDDRAGQSFAFEAELLFPGEVECSETDFTVFVADTEEAVDVAFETEGDAPLAGTFSGSDLDAGAYDMVFDCETDGGPQEPAEQRFEFSRVTIDKLVEGDAPDDASFLVRSECEIVTDDIPEDGFSETFDVDLEYASDGGTASFIFDEAVVQCFMTETDDGGAFESSFDLAEHSIETPEQVSVEVTNTFEPEEVDDEEDEDEDEDEDEEEAEAAEPIEEEPDYTG